MQIEEQYYAKADDYFSWIRWDIIELIPEGNHRILDIGCGNGATLKKLKEMGKADSIFGIEVNKDMEPFLHSLDGAFIGDIESSEIPFSGTCFDYIIFGDVLEHLINPGKILCRYKKLLKNDGHIIASLPNIKNISVVSRLILLDEFHYRDAGILDMSHLRFFTKKEIKKLFTKSHLTVTRIEPNLYYTMFKLLTKMANRNSLLRKYPVNPHFKKIGLVPGGSFLTLQYLVVAKNQA
jgi:2-polyprenyl-3-methyl-5-hydroxy-6-metoxy-1,4-benzoquinol methylase